MVKVAKMGINARITSATTYFHEKNNCYLLRIQFMYEDLPRSFGKYQVYRFSFSHERELARCVNEFKSFLGVSKLGEIEDNRVELYVYAENSDGYLNKAELLRLVSPENANKQWYPCAIGISESPRSKQTILSY